MGAGGGVTCSAFPGVAPGKSSPSLEACWWGWDGPFLTSPDGCCRCAWGEGGLPSSRLPRQADWAVLCTT